MIPNVNSWNFLKNCSLCKGSEHDENHFGLYFSLRYGLVVFGSALLQQMAGTRWTQYYRVLQCRLEHSSLHVPLLGRMVMTSQGTGSSFVKMKALGN